MGPRVLAALPGTFPSTVLNVVKPLMRLHAAGAIELDLSFHFVVRRRQIARADVLVLSHTINPAHAWILDVARERGTPLLYDIDENLLEPPPDDPGLDFHHAPARQAAVRQALTQASIVRTYAPALARYLEPFNRNVVRADGPVEWRLVPDPPRSRGGDRVHVVYATSRRRDPIGAVLTRPLLRVLDAHPNVDVTIWGPRFADLEAHPRVRFRDFERDYDRYFEEFARAGFDIGLAPMPDALFYQCKTATKFRDYAACRIAGVYADTEMYRDCVTDGVTGLLVPAGGGADDAWVAAMATLIGDAALRARIQTQAESYARERYADARIEGDWLGHIDYARRSRAAVSGHVAAAGGSPRPARSSGLRQVTTSAGRLASLLRTAGTRGLWTRGWAHVANLRQLLVWEVSLRRMHRPPHHH